MNRTLDFLTPDWIDRRLAPTPMSKRAMASRKNAAKGDKNPRALIAAMEGAAKNPTPEFELEVSIDSEMERAALEHVRGVDAGKVRQRYRAIAEPWEAIFSRIDWTPRAERHEQIARGDAEAYRSAFKACLTGIGNYRAVAYKCVPQPYDPGEILQCAAMSGDADLARRIARSYRTLTPAQAHVDGSTKYCVLRELLAGREKVASEHAKYPATGYSIDSPPDRVEFPLGVLRGDAKLVLSGLKAIKTRYQTAWDIGRLKRRHAAVTAQFAARRNLANAPTWDEFANRARQELVGMKWMLSTWAIAFLNVARWRGLNAVFANQSAFCEWVPYTLCA
jgi:hypothetical protein